MLFGKKEEKKVDFKKGNHTGQIFSKDNKKITAIIESLPDGVLLFDEKNNLSMINFQAQMFLNVSSGEVLGKNILELSQFTLCQPLVSLLGGGLEEKSNEEISLRNDLIVELSSSPIMEDSNKIGTVVALKDITQKKGIGKIKSDFITIMAHQLRTPTSIIKWASQELLDGDLGEISEEQKGSLEKIYFTNEKMISLVNNLLVAIEVESNSYGSKPVLSDVLEIIKSVVADYEGMANKNNIKIILKIPSNSLPEVMIDKDKIKIVLSNLIDNALKYSHPKGEIKISIEEDEGELVVKIEDNGIGISKKEQEKVFSKFFRGQEAMKIDTEGKGLGLFIAKNIIEYHGGEIGFESREDKGSLFYFTLPIKSHFGEYLTGDFY